jgi:hypothetical protein
VLLALLTALAPAGAADQLFPLDIRHVKLGGELGRRLQVTVQSNLLALDADREFLAPFREKQRRDGYIGLGKLIDTAVRLAAVTGDPRLLRLKQHLVSTTLQAQEPDGYLGILTPEQRVWTLWDIHEMSYLVYGLSMDHRFFGEQPSLAAGRKLADYIMSRWTAQPGRAPGGGDITVHMAVTGLESAMLALHQQTQDARYLDFCRQFRRLEAWDARIVTGRWGPIEGHAYAHLCRCIAQLRLYRLQPAPVLREPTRAVLDFLTRGDGLVITGECGDHECWHDTQEGAINLGESCATAYLLRFLDELLRLEADPLCGDLMERIIFNGLFAAQSPDGRQIRYYTPFDGPRSYFNGDTYCCPNNYRRIIAELPGLVAYRRPGEIVVSLYTPSTATIQLEPELSVRLGQETAYPSGERVVIRVEPARPASFALRLRIPRWCARPRAAVNHQSAATAAESGTWLVLNRQWNVGDQVALDLPMPWRLVKGRKAQAGRVAVLRGPQVFCLNRARHKELAAADLRLLVIDPASLEGPFPDDSIRPGGQSCRVRAWPAGAWYPSAKPELTLTLTEFPDPGGEAIYFKVPNPNAPGLVHDELALGAP